MPEKIHRKPKPAPGMNSQWTADEEEIMAAARAQFALAERSLRLSRWTRWLKFFTFGMLASSAVRIAADAQVPQRAAVVQALVAAAVGVVWLAFDWLSRRADDSKITHVALATQNIKYVPPPADEVTGIE